MRNKSYEKICKRCNSKKVIKFGKKRGKQRYKCKDCEYIFCNSSRKGTILSEKLYRDFANGKQTYKELAKKYKISINKIQKLLDEYKITVKKIRPQEVVLLIDTTYFGDFGIMVFKDSKSKLILKSKIVEKENYHNYKDGIKELQEEGWIIKAIVCDGKKGLLGGFGDIPTQMCNYHQVAIVTRYITKRPILEANKDLRKLSLLLTQTDKETFEYELKKWYEIYKDFLNEKGIDEKGKSYYIHKRTRSAYFSLKNNLNYLFIWYNYYGIIDIPNTTNGLEGYFSHLKAKIKIHRGLKKERKLKLIFFLINQYL